MDGQISERRGESLKPPRVGSGSKENNLERVSGQKFTAAKIELPAGWVSAGSRKNHRTASIASQHAERGSVKSSLSALRKLDRLSSGGFLEYSGTTAVQYFLTPTEEKRHELRRIQAKRK